ncbi:MAG: hypothetical protein R3309_12865 [Reinekea sp.]|nr:hypothetical protein [Reinekea sp.]
MNNLLKRQQAIKAKKELHTRTISELSKSMIVFTASMAEVRLVHQSMPHFLFRLDPDIADYYKEADLPWSLAVVVLNKDKLNGRFEFDTTLVNLECKYEDLMNAVWSYTQEELDAANPTRTKNIAILATVGECEFEDYLIERMISIDPEFYESEGLITSKEQARRREREIKALEALC